MLLHVRGITATIFHISLRISPMARLTTEIIVIEVDGEIRYSMQLDLGKPQMGLR